MTASLSRSADVTGDLSCLRCVVRSAVRDRRTAAPAVLTRGSNASTTSLRVASSTVCASIFGHFSTVSILRANRLRLLIGIKRLRGTSRRNDEAFAPDSSSRQERLKLLPAARVQDVVGLDPASPSLVDAVTHCAKAHGRVRIRGDRQLHVQLLGLPAMDVVKVEARRMRVNLEKAAALLSGVILVRDLGDDG